MKTTQKNWSKMFLAEMAVMVLAFGLVVIRCNGGGAGDNRDTDGSGADANGETTKLVGTWKWLQYNSVDDYVYKMLLPRPIPDKKHCLNYTFRIDCSF